MLEQSSELRTKGGSADTAATHYTPSYNVVHVGAVRLNSKYCLPILPPANVFPSTFPRFLKSFEVAEVWGGEEEVRGLSSKVLL